MILPASPWRDVYKEQLKNIIPEVSATSPAPRTNNTLLQHLPFLPQQWPLRSSLVADHQLYFVQTPSDTGLAAAHEMWHARLAYPSQELSAASQRTV